MLHVIGYLLYLISKQCIKIVVVLQIRVLRTGLPIAREKPEHFADFWLELGSVLEGFLFPESSEEQKQEDRMADEAVDCHIIELLREEVLPFPKEVTTLNTTMLFAITNS